MPKDHPSPGLRVIQHAGRWTEFQTPRGTATIQIDQDRQVMEIFVDPEVDPLDWDVVCGLLARMGVKDIGEPSYVGGVDTWSLQLRGPVPLSS